MPAPVALNQQLEELVQLCLACATACASCGDAFAVTGLIDTYRACALACADCADICRATANVAGRYDGGGANVFAVMVRACAKACAACSDACLAHPSDVASECARTCTACQDLCGQIGGALRWR